MYDPELDKYRVASAMVLLFVIGLALLATGIVSYLEGL